MDETFVRALIGAVGAEYVRTDAASLGRTLQTPSASATCQTSSSFQAALRRLRQSPASATSSACRWSCAAPGPATPEAPFRLAAGVVLSMERLNRILAIDEANLLAVVEPGVVDGDLQRAVEAVGLFYPPDPASLEIVVDRRQRGRVRRRAARLQVRHDTRYVLALEAVLAGGQRSRPARRP